MAFLEFHQRLGLETELGHIEAQVFFVEQPEHDLLAPQRGQSANAEIELLLAAANVHLQHDAAVLRQPLLADIEFRHDLQAGGDGVLQLQRRRHDRLQHAVNTEADAEFFFVRLDMNVAGSPLDSVAQHNVHQLDDWSFIGCFFQFGQSQFLFLLIMQFDVASSFISDIDCITVSRSSSLPPEP